MRQLIVCSSIAFPEKREVHTVEAATVREAIYPRTEGVVVVGGRRVPPAEWDDPLPDGADVAVAPSVGEPLTVFSVLLFLATTAYNYIQQKKLQGALKAASERGGPDEASPTYRFEGALSTTSGPGYTIPIVGGRHRVGGQIISQVVRPAPRGFTGEVIQVLIAVSQGPVYAIAGERGLPNGERDQMGELYGTSPYPTIPAGIEVNGAELQSRSSEVSIRLGHPSQGRLAAWPQSSFTQFVGRDMNDAITVEIETVQTEFIDAGSIAIDFPAGLYTQSGNALAPATVLFDLQIRDVSNVFVHGTSFPVTALNQSQFTHWVDFQLGAGARRGPYTVRLQRTSTRGDPSTTVDSAYWRSCTQTFVGDFTHPGLALLGVSVSASEKINNAATSVTSIVSGILVRGWRSDTGWSAYGWGPIPPSWNHDIGRNAAWILAEILLNRDYGLGHEIRRALGGTGEEELDLYSFYDSSLQCDLNDPYAPGEAKFRCDIVIDSEVPAIDIAQQIAATSRLHLCLEGDKIALRPEYRDAYGGSVPARTEHRFLSTSNCSSVSMTFRNPSTSPNVITAQFNNAAIGYRPDQVVAVDSIRLAEETEGVRPRTVQASVSFRGITRQHSALREAHYALNWFRLSNVEARVTAGLFAVPIRTRDVLWLHHECWYPDPDSPSTGARCLTEALITPVSSIVLDRDLQVYGATRTGTGVFVVDPDGTTLRALTVNMAGPATILAGDPVPLWDPALFGGAGGVAQLLVNRHAPVIGGRYGTFARRFVVTGMSARPDLMVDIDLAEWHPDIHNDPPPEALMEFGGEGIDLGTAGAPPLAVPPPSAPRVVSTVSVGSTTARGVAALSWVRAPDSIPAGRSRVYARPAGATVGFDLLAEVDGTVAPLRLEPGVEYDVAVVQPGHSGAYASPADSASIRVRLPIEAGAPPAPVSSIVATTDGHRVRLSWPKSQGAVSYEVRRGPAWLSARRIVSTRDTVAEFGAEEGEHRLMVRARSSTGSWSTIGTAVVQVVSASGKVDELDDIATAGTHAGTEDDGGEIVVTSPGIVGTYTSPEFDPGVGVLLQRWGVLADWRVDDNRSLDAIAEPLDWWTDPLDGADTNEADRGIQASGDALDDHTEPLDEWGAAVDDRSLPIGYRGVVRVETRHHDGAWSAWTEYDGPANVVASKMQARLVLRQEATRYRVAVDRFVMTSTPN